MSCYSLERGLLFIHIPKNAGVSIRKTLGWMCPDLHDFDEIDERHREKRNPALANHFPYGMIETLPQHELPDLSGLRSFMVVRNPWARMVSLYFHRMRKLHLEYQGKPRNTPEDIACAEKGFREWLLNTPSEGDSVLTRMPQTDWGRNSEGHFVADRVLRMEDLVEDWRTLMREWGLPENTLPSLNTGKGESKAYRDHYDADTYDHVQKYFAEDIDRFGYTF